MSKNLASKSFKSSQIIVAVSAVVVIALVAVIIVLLMQQTKVINNFSQCKEAGGMVMQTFPEQCSLNGKTFTNSSAQSSDNSNPASDYIGLTEAEALAKAKQDNVPARVLERNGEQLPSTEDFSPGRHNLTIKDGKVSKDVIEK